MKVVPVIDRLAIANDVPSLESCASTISKAFSDPIIAEFNTRVQVRVISDPTTPVTSSGLPLLLISMREDGVGTMKYIRVHYMHAVTIKRFQTHFES